MIVGFQYLVASTERVGLKCLEMARVSFYENVGEFLRNSP